MTMLASRSAVSAPPCERERWLRFTIPNAQVGQYASLRDGSRWLFGLDFRWHEQHEYPAHEMSLRDAERMETVGALAVKQDAVAPTKSDIRREFPDLPIVEHEDGTWEAKAPLEPERRARLEAMHSEVRALEVEKGEIMSDAAEMVTLKTQDGRTKVAPVHAADEIARRQNLRPVRKVKRVSK